MEMQYFKESFQYGTETPASLIFRLFNTLYAGRSAAVGYSKLSIALTFVLSPAISKMTFVKSNQLITPSLEKWYVSNPFIPFSSRTMIARAKSVA